MFLPNFSSTNLKPLILFLPLLIFFLFVLLFSHTSSLQITSLTPSPQSLNVPLNTPITIIFNKPISPSLIHLQSLPKEQFSLSQPNPKTIIASHSKPFFQDTTYQIQIFYRQKLLQTLVFKTQKSQNEPRLLQEIDEEVKNKYPLAQYTPYVTNNFRVVYSAPLTLEIQLTTPDFPSNQALIQVKDWVKSHNLPPQSHQYHIKPLSSSPGSF